MLVEAAMALMLAGQRVGATAGGLHLTTNDPGNAPGSGESDPLRHWADGLAAVFEACLEAD